MSETTLMIREILIKVPINLIKHTPFLNFGESGKNTSGIIISMVSNLIFVV